MKKNAKIYIAGHQGMVGSAILQNLIEKGYNNFTLRSLEEIDLRNQKDVNSFFEQEKPEYVFLAAAKVGGIYANSTFRAEFIFDNLMIESNIIHAAFVNNVKKLLFLGSSCIYPRLAEQPIKEESLLTGLLENTNEPYAIAKIAGIKLCEAYRDQYGCNFISVMPTNLYGMNDNYNLENSHVMPAMLRKTHIAKLLFNSDFDNIIRDLKKRPFNNSESINEQDDILSFLRKYGISKENGTTRLVLWGSGKPYREFLHVDDMADACIFLMENYNNKEFLNIGTGKDISIKELSAIIREIVGFKGEIYFDAEKPDGTPKKLLDVSRLHSLGWRHKIELEDGIKNVYSDYLK